MCCLKYEDDYYTEQKKLFPDLNTKIVYNGIEYKITSYNVLSKNVKLEAEDSIVTITLDEVNKILHNKDVVEKENKKTKKEKRNNQFSLDDKHDKPSKKEEKKHEQKDNKQKKRYHNNNQNRQRKNKNNIKNNG